MRVLMVNYEYPPLGGGAANATLSIAREMASMGDQVLVLTSSFRGLVRREKKSGITIKRVPVWRRHAERCSIPEMLSFILSSSLFTVPVSKKWKAEALLAFFTVPCGHTGLLAKWLGGIPFIVSLRGGDVPGAQQGQLKVWHALTKPLIKLIWQQSYRVVANSVGLAALANETAPQLQVPVIPNGIDLERFVPSQRNVVGEELRFLFVGRASREKNVPELLSVLKDFNLYRWKFLVVGDGPELPAWRRAAAALKERVIFKGWVPKDRIHTIYEDADILLFPSTSEGMPNVVLEAMACGLPVVASKIRGNVDLVEDGINGFLYELGNREQLKNSLARLGDAALRQQMGREARKKAERFSWTNTAEQYRELLQNAVKERKR